MRMVYSKSASTNEFSGRLLKINVVNEPGTVSMMFTMGDDKLLVNMSEEEAYDLAALLHKTAMAVTLNEVQRALE